MMYGTTFCKKMVCHLYRWPHKGKLGLFTTEKNQKWRKFLKNFTPWRWQFQTKNQVFRSDNGKEYVNKAYVPQVFQALCFTNKAPKYLWGEAILTATYLINRMPTSILNFKTPLQVFTNCHPISRLSSTLPLKKFGCTVVVHIHDHNRGKLDPRARKCVFVGYAPTQKG